LKQSFIKSIGGSRQTGNFSKVFLIVTLCLYFINFLMGWKLNELFVLNPTLIVHKFEFWRIVTYPFIPGSAEGAALFFITFALFAPRLEEILGSILFSTVLFLLLCLHGILHTLIFWQSFIPLSGMEGLSMYVMSLFILLNIQNRLKIFRLPPLKSYIAPTILFIMWGGYKLFRVFEIGSVDIKSFLSVASFGLGSALMTYMQIRLAQKINYRRHRNEPDLTVPKPEELQQAVISKSEMNIKKYHYNADEERIIKPSGNREIDEERLNIILDKMNEKGRDSLSPEELNFLREYSKFL
jgi:membrane associated rhomboid family serine protease